MTPKEKAKEILDIFLKSQKHKNDALSWVDEFINKYDFIRKNKNSFEYYIQVKTEIEKL